nr:MAG TPA: hypothetical protein [Caudoviricetes sp.]DAR05728.1 MAG TPA: hypothetical protein [Caudoviricetes sp.]
MSIWDGAHRTLKSCGRKTTGRRARREAPETAPGTAAHTACRHRRPAGEARAAVGARRRSTRCGQTAE